MDLRRERKRSLKVREQQEAELDRKEASKKRYARLYSCRLRLKILINYNRRRRQKAAEAMAAKRRQSASVRQKEAEAMVAKRQAETMNEKFERRQKDAQSRKR